MKSFTYFLKTFFTDHTYGTWLLAISGGVDSVVLGQLMLQAGITFRMLHCNFQLRGEESSRDEDFVRQLAVDWNVPAKVKRFETEKYAADKKCSIQVAARQLRYAWFEEEISRLQAEVGLAKLATAHHANDSVETMLMNVMRGTGIEGMHGILPVKNDLIRPLLFATKQEILAYAKQEGIQWVEDSSNESSKYTRNFIRNEIIPAAESVFPAAIANMMGTIEKMKEAELLYMQAVEQHKKRLLQLVKGQWQIPVLLLSKAKPLHTITWELIKPFGFAEGQVDEVLKLCVGGNGAYVQTDEWRIIRNRNWLLVAPVQSATASIVLLEEPAGSVSLQTTSITWQTKPLTDTESLKQLPATEAWVDAGQLQWPLVARPWKEGDYLYPLGMRKKKKVARMLIDLKLSRVEKEQVWVLESNKKIVWVVGLRIDDRYKVRPTTSEVLLLKWHPAKA